MDRVRIPRCHMGIILYAKRCQVQNVLVHVVCGSLYGSLVTLSLLREPTPPWSDAIERLLNVIYGIVLSWLVAVILFPISAWRMVTDNYANSCSAIQDAVMALVDLFESARAPAASRTKS